MSVYYDELNIPTKGEVDIVDITNDVQKVVSKSKINRIRTWFDAGFARGFGEDRSKKYVL